MRTRNSAKPQKRWTSYAAKHQIHSRWELLRSEPISNGVIEIGGEAPPPFLPAGTESSETVGGCKVWDGARPLTAPRKEQNSHISPRLSLPAKTPTHALEGQSTPNVAFLGPTATKPCELQNGGNSPNAHTAPRMEQNRVIRCKAGSPSPGGLAGSASNIGIGTVGCTDEQNDIASNCWKNPPLRFGLCHNTNRGRFG